MMLNTLEEGTDGALEIMADQRGIRVLFMKRTSCNRDSITLQCNDYTEF